MSSSFVYDAVRTPFGTLGRMTGSVRHGWAVFAALQSGLGVPGAAAICGFILMICAGGLLWTVRAMAK